MESNATQQLKIFAPATNQEDEYFIEEDDEQLDGLLDDNPLEDESNSSLQFEYVQRFFRLCLSSSFPLTKIKLVAFQSASPLLNLRFN